MSKRDWQEGKNCDKNRRKKETSGNGMEWGKAQRTTRSQNMTLRKEKASTSEKLHDSSQNGTL